MAKSAPLTLACLGALALACATPSDASETSATGSTSEPTTTGQTETSGELETGTSGETTTATTGETTDETTDSTGTETTGDPTDPTTTGEPGASLGLFDLTYYWVAYEGDYAANPTQDVGTCQGQVIATVSAEFANALRLEGTGKLLDDRMLNIGGCSCNGGFNCFIELDPNVAPWGLGSQSNALEPFISIATDTGLLPFGTVLYAPDLDGQALPGGGVHDGCLRADDVGGGINGAHIDWFMGLRDNYLTLDPDVPEQLELFEGGTICP